MPYDSKKLIFPRISLAGLTEVLDVTGNRVSHKLELSQVQPSQCNHHFYNTNRHVTNDQMQESWNVIQDSHDSSTVHYYVRGKKQMKIQSQQSTRDHLALDNIQDSGETMTSL